MSESRASIHLDPAPRSWTVRQSELGSSDRSHLGLPTDRPVVMSGHQAAFWHAGILAKLLVTNAAARSHRACPAWIVVDQDVARSVDIAYPARDPDGSLRREIWTLDDARDHEQVPLGLRPPIRELQVPRGVEEVQDGLEQIGASLMEFRAAASLGEQITRATVRVLDPDAVVIRATELNQTAIFADLLTNMRSDPIACVTAYNSALQSDATLRPLMHHDDRIELPLWRVRAGCPREPVFAADLGSIPDSELAPRALLMTGLVRSRLCDLFVHGTGGGGTTVSDDAGYERIVDAWFEAWLGESPVAPFCVATATCLLDLADGPAPSESEVANARELAHKARHDPSLIGDDLTASRKRELVAAIADAKRSRSDASSLFNEMQDLLAVYRDRHAANLHQLEVHAASLEKRARSADILNDRTWSFPLLGKDCVKRLTAEIEHAFGPVPSEVAPPG